MNPKRLQILLLLVITFLAGYFFGVTKVSFEWSHYTPNITVINKEPPTSASLVDFSLFWNVWDKLTTNYYDKSKVDPQKMLYGAINGMVQSVGDPYTMFLPPTQNSNFQNQLAGQFSGIGAELGLKGKQIIVIAPLAGSPAQKMGIKAGDAILKVDGQSTTNWALPDAVNKIRGPKGSIVILSVMHAGDTAVHDLSVTRDTITIKSVNGWVKQIKDIDAINHTLKTSSKGDESIAYIQLSQFGDNTNTDWTVVVNTLYPKMQQMHPKGIILDLRDNPGGYLTDAVFIAGEFLPQGDTVVIQDSGNGQQQPLLVNRPGKFLNIPMIVLINKGSASASEIVSGALRDNKRAQLVGDTSFGKGTIQQAMDLGNGVGLHVTIAKWLTPNGTWVHGKGLTPDVTIALDEKDPSHDTQLEKAIDVLTQ